MGQGDRLFLASHLRTLDNIHPAKGYRVKELVKVSGLTDVRNRILKTPSIYKTSGPSSFFAPSFVRFRPFLMSMRVMQSEASVIESSSRS